MRFLRNCLYIVVSVLFISACSTNKVNSEVSTNSDSLNLEFLKFHITLQYLIDLKNSMDKPEVLRNKLDSMGFKETFENQFVCVNRPEYMIYVLDFAGHKRIQYQTASIFAFREIIDELKSFGITKKELKNEYSFYSFEYKDKSNKIITNQPINGFNRASNAFYEIYVE